MIEYLWDPIFITAVIFFILSCVTNRAFIEYWNELRQKKIKPAKWQWFLFLLSTLIFTFSGVIVIWFKIRYLWQLTDNFWSDHAN